MTRTTDGWYYWILYEHSPEVNEWMVALYVKGAGWQLPGQIESLDQFDERIRRVGAEVIRRAAE